jgi:hypothetical protein
MPSRNNGKGNRIASASSNAHAPVLSDEFEELEKLKGDFALTLEVLRCVLRKVQGIQTAEAEVKRANEILSLLLEDYNVPRIPPQR